MIQQQQKEIEQLRALLGQQIPASGSGPAEGSVPKEIRKEPNSRGYNVRKFHDFPHPEKAAPKKKPETKAVTRTCTADAEFCHDCGDKLSDWCERYTRKSKDLVDGKWTETEWDVKALLQVMQEKARRPRARRAAWGALRHARHRDNRVSSLHVYIL